MKPRLPRRLKVALELVPLEARSVADVGAGHGALSVHLAATHRVIATEAKPGPYAELCRNLAKWGAADTVETRQGVDLAPLRGGEADAIVVAGVGARTAMHICADAADKRVRWLVVQCMQHAPLVEPWLAERRWRVLRRVDTVEHGHMYATWLVGLPG